MIQYTFWLWDTIPHIVLHDSLTWWNTDWCFCTWVNSSLCTNIYHNSNISLNMFRLRVIWRTICKPYQMFLSQLLCNSYDRVYPQLRSHVVRCHLICYILWKDTQTVSGSNWMISKCQAMLGNCIKMTLRKRYSALFLPPVTTSVAAARGERETLIILHSLLRSRVLPVLCQHYARPA